MREQQIVAAVRDGGTNREIARRLGISEQTVKNHLWKVYGKLGIENRVQLALATLTGGAPAAVEDSAPAKLARADAGAARRG